MLILQNKQSISNSCSSSSCLCSSKCFSSSNTRSTWRSNSNIMTSKTTTVSKKTMASGINTSMSSRTTEMRQSNTKSKIRSHTFKCSIKWTWRRDHSFLSKKRDNLCISKRRMTNTQRKTTSTTTTTRLRMWSIMNDCTNYFYKLNCTTSR